MLRVKVKPVTLDNKVEHLRYSFSDETLSGATVSLSWDQLSIPFRIEVDYLQQQFDAFVTASQQPQGFTSQGLTIAANWCLQNKFEMEKALQWASLASGTSFPGDPSSFSAWSAKTALLLQLGRSAEASAALKQTLPLGNMGQLQQFGRSLIAARQPGAAMEVFQFNYDRKPDHIVTLTGMARGLSAMGKYSGAFSYAEKALALAPDEAGKQAIAALVQKLREGKDINQ